jgi:hypothetical protein
MTRTSIVVAGLCAMLIGGCIRSSADQKDKKEEQTGIFGKKTQDIGKFDPNAPNQVASDSKVHASDPITAPLSAYGPIMEQISKLGVEQAINLFYAAEGRYPKDHDEFMQRIIKENNIQLPVLPFKGRYKYDVEQHKLVVVRDEENAAKAAQ